MGNIITLDKIKKTYDGHSILDGFSTVIDSNTAVMGASGSGKTTLVRIIAGLERADSGRVHFEQQPRFSVVFQEDRLFEDFSAVENITAVIGRGKEREEHAREMLSAFRIDDADMTKPTRDFSGGMKRRVAIARALLAEHNILLLDEAFKGLDADTRDVVARVILEYSSGKLIILVTHDIREAELLGIDKIITVG